MSIRDWFSSWKGARPLRRHDLRGRLSDYPPYLAPYRGPSDRSTQAQAQENFDHLMKARAGRLATLSTFLKHDGIDIEGPLNGGPIALCLDGLHRWVNEEWPALYDPEIARLDVWRSTTREGREIAYSLVLDLSLFLGELIVCRQPAYRWDIDWDEVDRRDGMPEYQRAVVLYPRIGAMPRPIMHDVEHIVAGRFMQPQSVAERIRNSWAHFVNRAIAVRYEAAGLDPAGAAPAAKALQKKSSQFAAAAGTVADSPDADRRPPWAYHDAPAALGATRDARLARLGAELAADGLDLPVVLADSDPAVLGDALETWITHAWPSRAPRDWMDPDLWWDPSTHVNGPTADLYTGIADAAIALGEWARRHCAFVDWGIDRYEAHEADGQESFGRLVVLDMNVPADTPRPVIYDAFGEAFIRFQTLALGPPGERLGSDLARFAHFMSMRQA